MCKCTCVWVCTSENANVDVLQVDKKIKYDKAGAVAEIKEAALNILDQIQDRFPELPV